MRFVKYVDEAGEWRWHLKAGNNKIIGDSGEGYKTERACDHGIDLVKSATVETGVAPRGLMGGAVPLIKNPLK